MSTASTHAPVASPSDGIRALILGLLAVPGSTLAWDLPAGGLWIGLPLAVAAIVLGRRARRTGTAMRTATAGIVLGALCLLQMVAWTLVSLLD